VLPDVLSASSIAEDPGAPAPQTRCAECARRPLPVCWGESMDGAARVLLDVCPLRVSPEAREHRRHKPAVRSVQRDHHLSLPASQDRRDLRAPARALRLRRSHHRTLKNGAPRVPSRIDDVRTALSANAAHAVPRAMEPIIEIACLFSAASGPRPRPGERTT